MNKTTELNRNGNVTDDSRAVANEFNQYFVDSVNNWTHEDSSGSDSPDRPTFVKQDPILSYEEVTFKNSINNCISSRFTCQRCRWYWHNVSEDT